ncbi:acetyl-CoA C-acyltransferase, partial [Escherichia coli]
REDQDKFAMASHQKAIAAWKAGAFDAEVVAVPLPPKKGREHEVFAKDECPREDSTLDKLAKLAPAFRKGGTVTAGNSSPINDGSAALL